MAFTPKTFDFLMENRLHNSREWYQEHRAVFQQEVLEPMQQLVRELEPYLLQIDPEFITEPKTDRTISRVYRDTRFSRDKSLYRERMWCTFKRDKNLSPDSPAFYVQVSPDGVSYGCGWYWMEPSLLETMRGCILAGDPLFLAAQEVMEKQDLFVLEGEKYKRTRCPQAPKELWDWLDRKELSVSRRCDDPQLVFAPDLSRVVGERLLLLAPVYRFFLHFTQLENQRQRSLRDPSNAKLWLADGEEKME